MKALGEVSGDRPAGSPANGRSAKTNIATSKAGIAGLIKTVLSLQNRILPKHLHLKTPNPLIPWDQYPLAVPGETIPWDDGALCAPASARSDSAAPTPTSCWKKRLGSRRHRRRRNLPQRW